MIEEVKATPKPPMWVRKIIVSLLVFGTPILLLFVMTEPERRPEFLAMLLQALGLFILIMMLFFAIFLLTEWAGFRE